jgi:hypothetical protein
LSSQWQELRVEVDKVTDSLGEKEVVEPKK